MTKSEQQSELSPQDGHPFFTRVSVGILIQLLCAVLFMLVATAVSIGTSRNGTALTSSDSSSASDARESSDSENNNTGNKSAPSTDSLPTNDSSDSGETPTSSETAMSAENASAANHNNTDVADASADTAGGGNLPSGSESDTTKNDPVPVPADATASSTSSPNGRPLDDVRKRSRRLPLAGVSVADDLELCRILTQDPGTVALEFIGGEFPAPDQTKILLKAQPIDASSAKWSVFSESSSGLTRDDQIGEFILKDQRLSFHWLRNADRGKLPFCRLRISVGADSEVCDLWTVARLGTEKIQFAKSQQTITEFVPAGIRLPPFEIMELELTLDNWPEHELSSKTLKYNESVLVTFPNEDSDDSPVTVKFVLDRKDGRYGLRAEYSFRVPSFNSRRKSAEVEYEEKELTSTQLEKSSEGLASTISKIERELQALTKSLETLNARRDALVEQTANGGNNVQQAAIEQLDAQILDKEGEESNLRDVLEELNSGMNTIEKAKSLCQQISDEGKMKYRLYRPFAGEGGDIIIASTVSDAAPAEEAP